MTHHITAIVGTREALAPFIDRLGPPRPTALAFDLVIAPLDERRLDEIAMSTEPSFSGFTYLTPAMADEIGRVVRNGRILYMETDYFGGMGRQGVALFDGGVLRWKRAHSSFEDGKSKSLLGRLFAGRGMLETSPISQGLSDLDVVPAPGRDEFDTIGLGRFRTLDDLGFDQR